MTGFNRTLNPAFNALLSRLHEIAGQLAQQYQEDMAAASHEHKNLRPMFGDGSAGTLADGHDGQAASPTRQRSLSETSASSDSTANGIIPTEGTYEDVKLKAHGNPGEMQDLPAKDMTNHQSGTRVLNNEGDEAMSIRKLSDVDVLSGVWTANQSEYSHRESLNSALLRNKLHFLMRSPWVDQRDFDNVTLRDVMSVEMFEACSIGQASVELALYQRPEVQHVIWSSVVVHPESRRRGCWVVASMLFLLYDLVVIPLDVCFDLEQTTFTKAMELASAIFWTVDIFFTFFVGVQSKHTVETRMSKIACSYFKSWFIFDMALIIPEWITAANADGTFTGGQASLIRMARWWRLMRLMRMARMLRSGRMKPLLRRLIYVMNVSKVYLHLMQALAGLTCALIAFIHITSCMWYALGNSSDDGWVSVNSLKSASVGRAYAASVHWSFSRLNGMQSYNVMESVTEVVLDAFLIYVNLILSAYYSGTLVAVAMTSANSQSLNLWKLSILYVKRHRISTHLDMQMTKFLEHSVGSLKETAAEELTLLETLPKTMQHDLLFESRVQFLSNKPVLKTLLRANSRVIHQMSTQAVTQKVCIDGESVFEKGDPCQGMLFVTCGILFYSLGNSVAPKVRFNPSVFKTMGLVRKLTASDTRQLGAHSSLSEPVLWTEWTHLGSLRTIVETMLLVLSPVEFSQVLVGRKEVLCYAFKYAKRFVWELNHTLEDVDDLTTFHEITLQDLDSDMFEATEHDHFMFLSHYKVEAGTEATLMRDLFQNILREYPNHLANDLRSPIFVDSEDLTDLSKLREHVKGSHALVLLLTPGVFSRPWCLVEIVTAVNHNVNIVPVEIQRPGSKYNYPDDQFYANILEGKFLDRTSVDLLEGEGISLADVEKAIRKVFLKIAVPFSPHKTKGVREAELHDVLSRCCPGQDTFSIDRKTMFGSSELGNSREFQKQQISHQRASC